MDKYIGKRLQGRYEIEELIGVGGMAYVYKAHDTLEDRPAAVKILKDEFLSNEEFTRRFKNESKAIAIMSHPNIVRVYDVSFEERLQYIVMEYIDGITLKEYIDQQRASWKEAVHFTVQILRALQHAHDKGIVHRDIKPQNIMLLADGTIKVTDFGIAHFSHTTMRTGLGDRAIGSVHYISPEQARGGLIDEKADLYSVGIMMYEMLTGKLPFEADNAVSVAIMQLQSQPKKPTDINPDIPEGLEEITLKAMQKDPERRYQSAAEMLKDINDFKQNPGIRFEYKYFVDETPTKYVDAITTIRAENKEGEEEERKPMPIIPILTAVAIALVIVAVAVFGVIAFQQGWFGSQQKQEGIDIVVPDFVDEMYSDDWDKLAPFAGYVQLEYKHDDSPAGTVIKQNHQEGKTIQLNDSNKLVLTISKGPQEIKVPAYTAGMTSKTQYESLLKNAGLTPEFKDISDDTVKPGFVVKTSPEAGEITYANQPVIVYISTGENLDEEVQVPNVLYASQADAIASFEEAGFTVDTTNIEIVNGPYQAAGIVVEQFPVAGEKAARKTVVKLTVSSGYQDAVINIPFTGISTAVDVRVFIDGVLSQSATGLLASTIQAHQVTLTEQRDSYTVQIQLAASGTNDFKDYQKYSVNGKTGEATLTDSTPFTADSNDNSDEDDDTAGGLLDWIQ